MGSGQSSNSANKPVVVVLGGGYGGVAAAKALDATGNFFVVLVDRKNYFLHPVGNLRAAIDAQVARKILVPYNKALKHGIVLQADIEEVRPTEVQLHGRAEPIKFEYLVIATGSSYAFPGKVADVNIRDALARFEAFGARLRRPEVKSVVVVGGGSVGIELVGEIKEALPHLSVTLVHSHEKLINSEPLRPEFLAKVDTQLKALGVKVELNQRVLPPNGEVEVTGSGSAYWGLGSVTTSTGKQLPADLLLFAVGAKTNTRSLLASFAHVMKDERLIVNAHMQVQGYTNVFAAGDIAGTATKRAFYATQQGEIAAKNIITLVKNAAKAQPSATPKLVEFKGFAGHPLILTIGSKGGACQFMNAGESVWGSNVASMLKSKELFIEPQWAALNQKDAWKALQKANAAALKPDQVQFDVASEKHARQIASAMKLLNASAEDTKAALQLGLPSAQVEENQQFV